MIMTKKHALALLVLLLALSTDIIAKPKYVYNFKMIKPCECFENVYKDSQLEARFSFAMDAVNLTLTNKSEVPIKIRWNDVSFIDPNGSAHRVLHSGIKFDDRNKEMPTVSVPPETNVTDLIVPTEYVFWDQGIAAGIFSVPAQWRVNPFYPQPNKKEALALVGKNIEIYMPIETAEGLNNYRFTFQISLVEVPKKK